LDATAIMLALIIPVILLILLFAWWFRSGNRRAAYRPNWEYSGRIELIVWAIPALVILFLGGIAWIGSAGHVAGYLPAENYVQIFSSHGTIMIFFVAMPFIVGLMNFAVPLQIGSRDVRIFVDWVSELIQQDPMVQTR
jgi:hypothetical protein